ncbi:hypothetical protein [Pandoraea oxalativorans]|uniref:PPM-type phosphatase domain-containing protein n=1 Tax=Pandoraea oxalativorans TaxID=573737 RepID=A0A0E3Y9S4_9BURK|nr:hypothetical protein [Pandoraea oxalativorans]AKC68856.1 hypothetical protein MB84_04345 [Pandoraea oxalativorans]
MTPHIECISQGIYKDIPCEDVVGYHRAGQSILAWAIDGASTLSEAAFTTFCDVSDAGWFARKVAESLPELSAPSFASSNLHEKLHAIRHEYFDACAGANPMHEWPVAAATIVEINAVSPKRLAVSIHRYADCFELFEHAPLPSRAPDNPTQPVPQTYDKWKPHSGFADESLALLRSRRCQQQRNQFSSALTLNPVSAFNAKTSHLTLDSPAHILIGTDGLSRAWDTYGLMTAEEALRLVTQCGLNALLGKLRAHEATLACSPADSKRRDDASGVFLSFS